MNKSSPLATQITLAIVEGYAISIFQRKNELDGSTDLVTSLVYLDKQNPLASPAVLQHPTTATDILNHGLDDRLAYSIEKLRSKWKGVRRL